MNQIVMKPKTWLKPPRRRRSRIDEAELEHLADNLVAIGIMNPILATPEGEIIAGDRRWQAALLRASITDVPVRIVEGLEAAGLRFRRISENLQRADLPLMDKLEECKGLIEETPGTTQKDVAALLNVDPSTITRIMSLEKCVEAVRRAADEIGIKAVYELSKLPPEEQEKKLARLLGKRGGGNGGTGTVQPAKAGRIKIALPSGVVITLAGGDELSIEDAIRELNAALAKLRKAEKNNWDVKTFQGACRDEAAAG